MIFGHLHLLLNVSLDTFTIHCNLLSSSSPLPFSFPAPLSLAPGPLPLLTLSSSPSFRKQHEQLQAVIVRVLRPTAAPQQGQPAPEGEGSLETDDLLAVREVKLAYENVKVVDCLDLSSEGSAAWEAALKRFVDTGLMSLLLLVEFE